jgi:predicted HicB family RNase H-like nuclease
MNNTMQYKGYIGSVEFSECDNIFYGKVQGIRSLISYEGTNASELVSDFHNAVDDYLAMCADDKIQPEVAYKGSLNVRFRESVNNSV